MNTTIRKGKTLFYGHQMFTHGLARSGHFTLKEADALELYGKTLSGLADQSLMPENEEEQVFVEQVNQIGECSLYAAKLWKKYLKVIDKQKVCHSFSKSNGRTFHDNGNEYSFSE